MPAFTGAFTTSLRTGQSLDLPQLWTLPGLNFEILHGMIEPTRGQHYKASRKWHHGHEPAGENHFETPQGALTLGRLRGHFPLAES